MTIDDIIRTLQRVEAAHPDTTPALAPIRAALSGNQFAWIDPDDAGRVLGMDPSMVVIQLEQGFLPGERDPDTGHWRLLLAEIVQERAWREAIAGLPAAPLSDEDRQQFFAAGPGSFPWQRDRAAS